MKINELKKLGFGKGGSEGGSGVKFSGEKRRRKGLTMKKS